MPCTDQQLLRSALDTLEKDGQEPHSAFYRATMTALVAKVFGCYVGMLDMLGVYWYQNGQPEKAKAALKKAIDLLTNKKEYKASEAAVTIVYAECYLYMALIASEEGNTSEAEFYGAQSACLAVDMAKRTQSNPAWQIEISACVFVSELYLAMKNKPKAAEYAEMGLAACAMLAKTDPHNDLLEMRSVLEKFRKKALRRFF